MKRFFNVLTLVLAFLAALPALMAQTKTDKLDERYTTEAEVAILADTQYADVVFEDWNKNEVAIEAFIESENLSQQELDQLLKSWQVSVQGNSKAVRIISSAAPSTANLAVGETQVRGINDLISSSMQMMQPVMKNVFSPMLEQFALQLPADQYKAMKNISFDYAAYKRDGTKYLEQYKKKIEQNLGEDFDAVMKKWERNNKQKMEAGQGLAGSSLLDMPKSPFGKNMNFDGSAYARDRKAYVAAMNKKFGTSVSVSEVEKWRKDIDSWGADFSKDMQAWGERYGKQFGSSMESLGARFGKALESDVLALGGNIDKAIQGWSDDFAKKLEQMAEQQGGNLQKTVTRDANGNVSTQMTYSFSNNNGPVAGTSKPRGTYKRKIVIRMPKDAKLDLNVRHGNIKIAEAKNAKVNLSHGDFMAETISGDKTLINVAYSPVDVASWNYGTLQATYIKNCVIDKAKSITVNSRASSIVINELEDAAVITGSFSELSIPKLGKNFKTLNINVENSDVVLNLPETPFHFNFNGVRSRLNYPTRIDAKVMEGYNSNMVNGFYKSRNTDSLIAISSKFSDIVLN